MTELDTLARRAVACKGWRWLSGMRVTATYDLNQPHASETWVADDDTPEDIRTDAGVLDDAGRAWLVDDSGSDAMDSLGTSLPDLADPCTIGGLLHLVREAWGMPELTLTGRPGSGEWCHATAAWSAAMRRACTRARKTTPLRLGPSSLRWRLRLAPNRPRHP